MLWASWTALLPSLLVLTGFSCWLLSKNRNIRQRNLVFALGILSSACLIAPQRVGDFSVALRASCMTLVTTFELDRLALNNASMIVTGAAFVWLLRRAFQTLWKPVPELINILGVEVPVPPDVSLTAIGVDKATVTWTRPPPNRPVHKFVIQVNGVNVGESATNQDTFITVSGLKPDHFYNVRIIAVGSNNFQAGSRVLRLRTFGENGRPRLGTSRLPNGFSQSDLPARQAEMVDENGVASKPLVATFGSLPAQDGSSSPAREASSATGTAAAPRRNTVGRRHSPSTTSLDKQPIQEEPTDPSGAQMAELNQRYLSLRRETEETVALTSKEDEETRHLIEKLETEKQEKRREQKKKEEQTEKLRREQGTTERSMRNALQRKAQKERILKEKQTELARVHENIAKLAKGIEDMKKEQESYDKQKGGLEEERDVKVCDLRDGNADLAKECSRLEVELKDKRQLVKELEDARKQLPGNEEDSDHRQRMRELKTDYQRTELNLRGEYLNESRRSHLLDNHIQILSAQLQQIPQANFGHYDAANVSGYNFDSSSHVKRRSRNSINLSNANPSPVEHYSNAESSLSSLGFGTGARSSGPLGFLPGPYLPAVSAERSDADEVGFRALQGTAPLSPSATSLLPSNLFADQEPTLSVAEALRASSFGAAQLNSLDNDPQSPASSGRSLSIFSSPHGSSNNLPFPPFSGDASERRSAKGSLSSPIVPPGQPANHKLGNLFSLQRSRGAKGLDDGPALGSLKHGQSQSFPRQTDESDITNKSRRISLSNWNVFNRNSAGPEMMEGHLPPPSKGGFSARNLLPFASRGASSSYADPDPSSPRPASIASSDMPRASNDGNSIWGPPGESHVLKHSLLWSPDNAWSRNPSRRPSLHGSPSALKTNLASAEDEILDSAALASASQVGVIGSRPPASKKSLARSLNPNAPTFMTGFFRPKPDKEKDKDGGKERDKPKGKDKDRAKDKTKDKAKPKDSTPDTPVAPTIAIDESPSESRISRDGLSVHTQTSVSESRESLSLDHSMSNTPSEPSSSGIIGGVPDNAFRKLFRKDSTSKLSFSQKFKRSKGPGSVTNSEKNMSAERSSMGDFDDGDDAGGGGGGGAVGRGFDSVTSSPSLGPSKSRDKPESKLKPSGSWFSIKKKTREKESLEMDRASEASAGGEEDKRA